MNPFQIAERFLQLHKKCVPQSWGDTVLRINELIINPILILCLFFVGAADLMMVVSAAMSTYNGWKDWIDYHDLKFKVQMMHLHMMKVGGPFIRTNDSYYMPYVYADAVMRTTSMGQHHYA